MPKRKAPSGPSARARRAIAAAAPKLIEGDRVLLGLRGPAASAHSVAALRDLLSLKRVDARMLQRKNEIRPFEDASSLEFLMERNGCSAFLLASHTKKRPHNLVLGRTFDGHILDQLELGLEVAAGGEEGSGGAGGAEEPGTRDGAPLFVFKGDAWARVPELATLQSLLLDVFGARAVTLVTLKHLDHVHVLTAVEEGEGGAAGAAAAAAHAGPNVAWQGVVHWRAYSMRLAVTGGRVPRVEMQPAQPALNFRLRRAQVAAHSLRSEAMKKPAGCVAPQLQAAPCTLPHAPLFSAHNDPHAHAHPHRHLRSLKERKIKNVTRDELGATLGRVHMERQDMDKLQLKKTRATKAEIRERKKAAKAGGGGGGAGEGGEEEGEEEEGEEGEEEEEEMQAPALAPGAGSKRARQ